MPDAIKQEVTDAWDKIRDTVDHIETELNDLKNAIYILNRHIGSRKAWRDNRENIMKGMKGKK